MKDDDILQAVREFKQRAESYWHDIFAPHTGAWIETLIVDLA